MAQSRGIARPIAALAAALTLLAAPALAAERLIVPFRINEFEHMVVDVEINGQARTTAVLDTAATLPMLDSRTVRTSGVAVPDRETRKVEVLGLNGIRTYPVVDVETITMGNLNLRTLTAAYNEDLDVPGAASNVLPSDAFPGDVLEFNFEKGHIAVYDGKPDRAPSGVADSIRYDNRDGLIFVSVRINGEPGTALIDTGSNISYVNSAFARSAKMRANSELTQRLQGATGGNEDVRVASARKLTIGDFYFSNIELLVADPFLFEGLGLADQPAIVLGLDYLALFNVQFDRRREQMVLTLPGARVNGLTLDLDTRASRIP